MTDNRTTELREKLTERGVKWIAYEKECNLTLEGFFDTRWDANGVRWSYLEINGKTTLSVVGRMEVELTPEQAIAATLGSEREKALEELVRDWQVLAEARLDDEITLLKRIAELEELVRDMWEFGESSNYPYTPLESVRWAQMREEYRERIAALGMEVDA